MVLRTYPFTHLRVGEAGRTQTVLAILAKLLPQGSSMNPDVAGNSVHVLTTPGAHKAAWEYLSAVDIADAPAASVSTIPEDVKLALRKLAENGDESAKMLAAIDSLSAGMSKEIAEIDARQRRQLIKLAAGGVLAVLLLLAAMRFMLHRAPPEAAATVAPASLALAPEQLTSALTPVHEKMRGDMLGLLNEVAIKLQAQHNEQQKLVHEQQKQLDDARQALADERRQFINEAGTMVVQAVERVDATTAKLAKQQDKVAALVQELQDTVRELDETKDDLRTREIELEQERAKIAALSLLLEEGSPLPGSLHGSSTRESAHANGACTLPNRFVGDNTNDRLPPCTTPDPTQLNTRTTPQPRFQFLPPDHPET